MKFTTLWQKQLNAALIAVFLVSLTVIPPAAPVLAAPVSAPLDTNPQSLPFTQDWSNTSLISSTDNWSGVNGITGYRGDDITTSTGTDPQTLTAADPSGVENVIANQTNPGPLITGGVAEFEITDPVVALQGSDTADAPYLLITITTTGLASIQVSYNLRDLDDSTDNAVQPVALHFRVGSSGSFTNVPAAFVADATDGPSVATQVTPVNVTLPPAVENQALVQLRIMTTNAVGFDEWVGVDDVSITGTAIGDFAPAVSSTSPVNKDTGVARNGNLTITFSEPVTVSAGWYAIACAVSGVHTAALTDNNQIFTLDLDADFAAGEQCTVSIEADKVADQDTNDPPDQMVADYAFSFTVESGVCGDPATPIHTVQGSGAASAYDGTSLVIEGVVVGDFHDDSNFNMFFVQEEDEDADSDPMTSEGIAVYDGSAPPVDVATGDIVRVVGTVDEFNGLTELTGVTVTKCGTGSATPAELVLPVASLDDFEAVEGMRVTFPRTMTVAEHLNLARYGEILLSGEGRLFQFTHDSLPDVTGYSDFVNNLALKTITLDDRVSTQNPDPVIHPYNRLEYTNTLRLGDYVNGLSGVLSCNFGIFRILPDQGVTFTSANERPESTPDVGGTFQVASMNVLNYFNTFINCAEGVGGTPVNCRGANNANEFERQRNKILDAILRMDAAVVGLMEIENDGYGTDSALQDLVNGLNTAAGAGTYAMIDADASIGVTNALGMDAIKVALIYQPDLVTPIGASGTISDTLFERHPLAQAFKEELTGAVFTVVVTHFKSKGCTDATGLDLDQGDGQSCYNAHRTERAQALIDWLATDPLGVNDPDYLVIGDLNSYKMEDPIQVFLNAGFVDLLNKFEGTGAYSYVFNGQLGYLDHALASPSLAAQVNTASHWHINADEPRAFDYNLEFKSPAQVDYFFDPAAFRSSDHDPVLVGMLLRYHSKLFFPLVSKSP